jgi:hypothetical protein
MILKTDVLHIDAVVKEIHPNISSTPFGTSSHA